MLKLIFLQNSFLVFLSLFSLSLFSLSFLSLFSLSLFSLSFLSLFSLFFFSLYSSPSLFSFKSSFPFSQQILLSFYFKKVHHQDMRNSQIQMFLSLTVLNLVSSSLSPFSLSLSLFPLFPLFLSPSFFYLLKITFLNKQQEIIK